MLENNDINKYFTFVEKPFLGCQLFDLEYRNKNIVDLACGNGSHGKHALLNGANFVKFADARSENFSQPKKSKNWNWQFVDLNDPIMLDNVLVDQQIILYSGHFYHTNLHLQILNCFAKTSFEELYFETKVFPNNKDYHEGSPDICWCQESLTDSELMWHAKEKNILIGQPNFKWTFNELQKRFTIKNIKVIEGQWYNPSFKLTVNFYKLMFHCLSQN